MKTQETKFKQTEIGNIPEDWEVIELKNLCEITSSKRIFRADYVDEGIPFYRSKEIIEKSQGKKISTEFFITEERFNKIKEKYGAPQKMDILISAVGARSGIPYYVNDEEEFYFKDGNLIWFKKFKDKICSKYLFYFLKSDLGQGRLKISMIGSAQEALTIEGVKKIKISLPPLPEQKAIAKILSSLDDKIFLNQRMNETLEAIAQAIFKHWFVDFEFPNEEGKPYKSSGGEMVYNEELGKEIPKGWRVGRLEEIANLTMGLSPKGESYNEKGEGLPLLNGAADFSEGGLSPKKFTTQPVRVCKREDIVFCIRATIGNITFSDGIYCLGRSVAALSSKEDVYKEFIYFILNHHLQRMSSQASGTVIVGLKKNDINNLTFIMPPKKFIEKFHGCISHLFNRIKLNFEEIDSLTKIRDALLPKLMSGEIRVKVDDMEEET